MRVLISEPQLCGMGEGAQCCAFLVAGGDGFECGRASDGMAQLIRERLSAGTMNAQYDPLDLPFPKCQSERPSSDSQSPENPTAV